jgi:hypothetical protein
MEQDPPDFTPEAATAEPASSRNPSFETPAEELAWWTGLAEGMRRAGVKPAPDVAARLKALRKAAASGGDPFDFDPVPVRARHDGWTPKKQRLYVEGLADTGCASEAAARVGMTEQSANRLRRRPDARGSTLLARRRWSSASGGCVRSPGNARSRASSSRSGIMAN